MRKWNDILKRGIMGVSLISFMGCSSLPQISSVPTLSYVGSSTIANFIREADSKYDPVRFTVDTEPESIGGEMAIREGRADLAGVAVQPQAQTLNMGIKATLIGRDVIVVVVNSNNPVTHLTRQQLKEIFTGKIRNWNEVNGEDLEIVPYIVSASSATRNVFRSCVLGQSDYSGCEIVRPDHDILRKVKAKPGAIGQISFSFLRSCGHVKVIAVDGEKALPTNFNYPIGRPLYLLWWPRRERVSKFIDWTHTPESEAILLKYFAKAKEKE